MANAALLQVRVLANGPEGQSQWIGDHKFLALPRVGDHVVVNQGPDQYLIEVTGVTHFGEAVDARSARHSSMPDASAQIVGKRLSPMTYKEI